MRFSTAVIISTCFAWLTFAATVSQAQVTSIITTVAGGGPNQIPATSSSICSPEGTVGDASGNLFISSYCMNRIYRVDPTGKLTVYVGTSASPSDINGDGEPATEASLHGPSGLALDSSGNLYIADSGACVIREVVASTGIIKTVAGNYTCYQWIGHGTPVIYGDGGPALSAEFEGPTGVFVDPSGNIFIADYVNCAVREVVAATGIIYTVAGSGMCGYSGDGQEAAFAQLSHPYNIFTDQKRNIFIADSGNNVVREVVAATGIIQTVAGNGTAGYSGDGGPATSAQLNFPQDLSLDDSGNILIADTGNFVVREIVAATGNIHTVAGNGTGGYSGDGGPATSAELGWPTSVFFGQSGNLFIADAGDISDTGSQVVREVVAATGDIETVAGNGQKTYSGDGFPAADASLRGPNMAFADHFGDIFIADSTNNVIREVVAATGIIRTVAGTGVHGYSGDGGPATSAELAYVLGVFVDGSGNIFIADSSNNVIREVMAATGIINTIVGTGVAGYGGDGQAATSAMLHYPSAVFVDRSGNLFIADQVNFVVREVLASSGIIVTAAGNGTMGYSGDGGPATSAELGPPTGVFVDNSGNIFIADSNNQVVREVLAATGTIETVAGNGKLGYSGDGGPATSASLSFPSSVFVDGSGDMFIADSFNSVVREVLASTGVIQTVGGIHKRGYTGDGGSALSAAMDHPAGVAQGASGSLLIADDWANTIRSVSGLLSSPWASLSTTSLKFSDQIVGTGLPAQTVTVTNSGTALMTVGAVTIGGANSGDFTETDNCAGKSVAPQSTCTVAVTFKPSVAAAESAFLIIANSGNGPQTVSITGGGITMSLTTSGGSTTQTVKAGQTAIFRLQLSVAGGAAATDQISAKITCTGAPAQSSCTAPPAVVATPANPASFQLMVQTTGSSTAALVPPLWSAPNIKLATTTPLLRASFLLLLFAVITTLAWSRHSWGRWHRPRVVLVACFTSLLLLTAVVVTGCGSSPKAITPATTGTYTLTVTAAIGNQTTTTQLTLVVQ